MISGEGPARFVNALFRYVKKNAVIRVVFFVLFQIEGINIPVTIENAKQKTAAFIMLLLQYQIAKNRNQMVHAITQQDACLNQQESMLDACVLSLDHSINN